MKRLTFVAGASVILSDDMANAIIDYARALAAAHTADTVTVRALTEDATEYVASLLLGPATQLAVSPADGVSAELNDAALVEELRVKTLHAEPEIHPEAEAQPKPERFEQFDEFDR